MAAPDAAEEVVCRICFDGAEGGQLLAACACSGTQALVHDVCLSRWRRIQLVQGKLAASQKCEICLQKYSASLSPPVRPFYSRFLDYLSALVESAHGLVVLLTSGSVSSAHIAVFLLCFALGIGTFLKYMALVFPLLVLVLYANGLKLSVLSGGGQRHLGLTSFGQPVEGLGKGMLLVSLGARGPFAKTVLYVHEHSDSGSLALILNGHAEEVHHVTTPNGVMECTIKTGGPVKVPGYWCIHNVIGVGGSERIHRERNFYISSGFGSLHSFAASCQKQCLQGQGDSARALFVKNISSWGPHQLDGEMRRWAWGWIRPEHANLDDIFNAPDMVNRVMPSSEDVSASAATQATIWEQFVNSPHLEMFDQV